VNAEEAKGYWENRWLNEGTATVGHVGDSPAAFKRQTQMYGAALQKALQYERSNLYPNLLDYGCGWGRMHEYLTSCCINYLGVDHSQEAVTMAEETHPLGHFEQIDPKLPQLLRFDASNPMKFDAVVTCTVLQHIIDPRALVNTVSFLEDALMSGGRMVLIENVSSGIENKPHIHYRSVSEYKNLFTSSMRWFWQDSVVHNEERHAILIGDKL